MKVIYASCLCSTGFLNEIFAQCRIKPGLQVQKFHDLLTRGLTANPKLNVEILSSVPVSTKMHKRIFWRSREECIDSQMIFHYLPFVNLPIVRQLSIFICSFLLALRLIIHSKRTQKTVVVCDVLNITVATAVLLASKITRTKSLAIATDVPGFTSFSKNGCKGIKGWLYSISSSVCKFFMHRYDMYVVLTEQMNGVVNPKRKPYIVIEGMVDVAMEKTSNNLEKKYPEKVIIYAGALYEKFGVKKLIEAFRKVPFPDVNLWLYGSGELEEEIRALEKEDSRIRYFGVVPNQQVVTDQLAATLLVNPRPSDEEFTKYSFPSKNMEYMVSGTPTLTTKLPGMPQEYYPYVYFFEDETVAGLTKTLIEVLSMGKEELYKKGSKAKEFVLIEKNNIIQANKVIELFEGV